MRRRQEKLAASDSGVESFDEGNNLWPLTSDLLQDAAERAQFAAIMRRRQELLDPSDNGTGSDADEHAWRRETNIAEVCSLVPSGSAFIPENTQIYLWSYLYLQRKL